MTSAPVFSVVIPCYGRPGPLAACLTSLQAQRYPAEQVEILAVDDGSAECLERVVPAVPGPVAVTWIRLPGNQGPAAARNAGAAAARGTYLAFIDDDCLADPGWLAALEPVLDAHRGAAVGGRIVDGSAGSVLCSADQTVLDVAYAHHNRDPEAATFFCTLNLAVPSAGFRGIGGFDPRLRTSEDREFSARWVAAGRRLVYAPDALVVHAATSDLRRFWRRHFAFGQGAYHFRSRYARTSANRIRLEPAAFYRRLLTGAFLREPPLRAARISAMVAVSQLASACGFFSARRSAQTSKGRSA